ncbi:MAG: DNA repair protein RadA, partial [Pseudomonadota bacterium]
MAKAKTAYVCTECGASSPKWVGQCPSCNAWNSLTETVIASTSASRVARLVPATATQASPLSRIEAEKIASRRTG